MSVTTKQKQANIRGTHPSSTITTITAGTVVDTNDPLQTGRLKIVCPQWGDTMSTPVDDLPWASRMGLFGGQTFVGTRGPGVQTTAGGVSYGLWAIPKVGATALVMCLDGDPHSRVWIGTMDDIGSTHTMPHGRWVYDSHPITDQISSVAPVGPLSTNETLIQPLADNLRKAFNLGSTANYEWRTRAADYSATGVSVNMLNSTYSNVADDADAVVDGWTSRQGYQLSRIDPDATTTITDKNYDSMVVSLTSPGFHSISMDDRQENCRVRVRTTAGHQVLLDDTNERVYISTAQGNNWIEMDQAGNIDMFTTGNFSVRAAGDINFASDQSIRMTAATGIHLNSQADIRLYSTTDTSIKSAANIRSHAAQSYFVRGDQNTSITAGANGYYTVAGQLNLKSGGLLAATAGGTMNIKGSGNVLITGPQVHSNGPVATTAGDGAAPSEQTAYVVSRVPDHEPWARTMTAKDNSTTPEFSYNDPSVGRSERGRAIIRGTFWRR